MPTVKQNLSLELERAWVFQALSCFSSLATGSGLHRVWRKVGMRPSGSCNSLGFTWLLYPTFFRAFYSLTKSSQVLATFGPGQFLGFRVFFTASFSSGPGLSSRVCHPFQLWLSLDGWRGKVRPAPVDNFLLRKDEPRFRPKHIEVTDSRHRIRISDLRRQKSWVRVPVTQQDICNKIL